MRIFESKESLIIIMDDNLILYVFIVFIWCDKDLDWFFFIKVFIKNEFLIVL